MRTISSFIRVLLVIVIIIPYFLLLTPFIVGINIKEGGIVNDVKIVQSQQFSEELKSTLTDKDEYKILFLSTPIRKNTLAVILINDVSYPKNSIVEITEKQLDWNVNWRNYPFANQPFNKLIVGDVKEVEGFEAYVLNLLNGENGDILLIVSGLTFLLGGLIIVLLTGALLRKPGLWKVPAVINFYILEISFFLIESNRHPIVGKPSSPITVYVLIGFGLIFLLLGATGVILWRAESNLESQKKVKMLYEAFIDGIKNTLK
jgi:hypothetical protein